MLLDHARFAVAERFFATTSSGAPFITASIGPWGGRQCGP